MNSIKITLLLSTIFLKVFLNSSSPAKPINKLIEPGVSKELAKNRSSNLSQIEYSINLRIPSSIDERIEGYMELKVVLKSLNTPLILDFKEPPSSIKGIKLNSVNCRYKFRNGHIIVPSTELKKGMNSIKISFLMGDMSLNRNEDFLYTLFVPDRASTAFPCFDQPDLKAKYRLSLEIPEEWIAVSNGKIARKSVMKGTTRYSFQQTRPLSTYLFSFVAGKFKRVTRKYRGEEVSLYHRETDSKRVERNLNPIFDLVFKSLKWMEDYTDIRYPFAKYDLITIPSFQYGGMEHTGATLYRASKLFLEESATISQKLARANLIAHETAHMWFGDLVTMKWFDDVWMKEVFANFMADKIVNPVFKDMDHKLRFLFAHYPASYSIDRTKGANPIAQPLANMKDAGTLYGQIIYHKAPIVMNHLEKITGKKKMRRALQIYLKKYSYSNATCKDLLDIVSETAKINLGPWKKWWLDFPGMGKIHYKISFKNRKISSFTIHQQEPRPQKLEVLLFNQKGILKKPLELKTQNHEVKELIKVPEPQFLILNGGASGYGYFPFDNRSRDFILKNLHIVKDPLLRGTIWLSLWENMLNRNLKASQFLETALRSLEKESNPLIVERILKYIPSIYWNFLSPKERQHYGIQVEQVLWKSFNGASSKEQKAPYFKTYISIANSPQGVESLKKIWTKDVKPANFTISRDQYITIAYELGIREVKGSADILKKQVERIKNRDIKEKVKFVSKALNSNPLEREKFFRSLSKEENRRVEPWVIEAIHYLHHPLRRDHSIKFILPSLKLMEEIQSTGDIFFPINWANTTLKNHNSPEAAKLVKDFLKKRPKYPQNLKLKILQAADTLFRAVGTVN